MKHAAATLGQEKTSATLGSAYLRMGKGDAYQLSAPVLLALKGDSPYKSYMRAGPPPSSLRQARAARGKWAKAPSACCMSAIPFHRRRQKGTQGTLGTNGTSVIFAASPFCPCCPLCPCCPARCRKSLFFMGRDGGGDKISPLLSCKVSWQIH